MKIIGKKSLASLIKYGLNLTLFGGIGVFISLPISFKWYISTTYGTIDGRIYVFLLGLLYVTGVFALLIVNEIRKIFNSLDGKDPFIMENVSSLKMMSIYSFIISFCYILKVFIFNSISNMIIIMIFVIAGLFSIILSEVFEQAVEDKQENDYTV
jgi:hypothetical protein